MAKAKAEDGNGDSGGGGGRPGSGLLASLWVLSKPRISGMAVLATAAGYLLAAGRAPDWPHMAGVVAATVFLAVGNSALNQYMERDTDRLMERTRSRPLPAGRLEPKTVLLLGGGASAIGVAALGLWANPLTAALAVLVFVTYLACYTPLKRVSALNTLVGAVPGALPPVLGWAAATGGLGIEALALFILLFVWQPPHFLAIAYLHREDYRRAKMAMLTLGDQAGVARRQMVIYSATLVPVSLYPATIGMAGETYFYGALILGLAFLAAALVMVFKTGPGTARFMLKTSVIYLPLVFALLIYDLRV